MSNSRDQRLKMICAAGDKIVNETGVNPSEVTGYAVSMAAFGRKPNGDFYILFEQWLKLRRAVPGAPPVDMPAEAAAELEEWSDHLKAQIMQRVTGIVRGVASSFEQTTALRVVALERLCADQARRNQEVLDTLVDTEAELGTARAQIAAFTNELQQERDRVQRLLGRLEERIALRQAEPSEPPSDPDASDASPAGEPGLGEVDDGVGAGDSDSPAQVPVVPDAAEIAHAMDVARPLADQPSGFTTDRPTGRQAGVPPAIDAAADQADGGGDSHG